MTGYIGKVVFLKGQLFKCPFPESTLILVSKDACELDLTLYVIPTAILATIMLAITVWKISQKKSKAKVTPIVSNISQKNGKAKVARIHGAWNEAGQALRSTKEHAKTPPSKAKLLQVLAIAIGGWAAGLIDISTDIDFSCKALPYVNFEVNELCLRLNEGDSFTFNTDANHETLRRINDLLCFRRSS